MEPEQKRIETALNLRPGDEIEIDGEWWRVTGHETRMDEAAPVTLRLHSRYDNMLMTMKTFPSQIFWYEPR